MPEHKISDSLLVPLRYIVFETSSVRFRLLQNQRVLKLDHRQLDNLLTGMELFIRRVRFAGLLKCIAGIDHP